MAREKFTRVRTLIRRMTAVSFAASCISFAVLNAFPRLFVSIFSGSSGLVALTVRLLPVYCGAVWIFGLQMGAQRTFVGLGRAETSIVVALLRKVILLIPLALILPHFTGVEGIFLAEPAASTISAVTSGILLALCYRKLPRTDGNGTNRSKATV